MKHSHLTCFHNTYFGSSLLSLLFLLALEDVFSNDELLPWNSQTINSLAWFSFIIKWGVDWYWNRKVLSYFFQFCRNTSIVCRAFPKVLFSLSIPAVAFVQYMQILWFILNILLKYWISMLAKFWTLSVTISSGYLWLENISFNFWR